MNGHGGSDMNGHGGNNLNGHGAQPSLVSIGAEPPVIAIDSGTAKEL